MTMKENLIGFTSDGNDVDGAPQIERIFSPF